MDNATTYRIFSLGDAALTIDFGNVIDEVLNKKVLGLFTALRKNPLPGQIEAVPAYSSLTLYYDVIALNRKIAPGKTCYEYMKEKVETLLSSNLNNNESEAPLRKIPVCYDAVFGPGLEELAQTKNLSHKEIVQIHTASIYRIYMLGFLPGFAYMGEVDERISMPRKTQPENVAAGSIGIAGKQTGIYPLASPGGWCIIGRTPQKMFDINGDGTPYLNPGDKVQFVSISKDEFESYQGGHS